MPVSGLWVVRKYVQVTLAPSSALSAVKVNAARAITTLQALLRGSLRALAGQRTAATHGWWVCLPEAGLFDQDAFLPYFHTSGNAPCSSTVSFPRSMS